MKNHWNALVENVLARGKPCWGSPGGTNGLKKKKQPVCQCRKHKRSGFDPWVGKIPWRRAWQSSPIFLSGESHWQRSLAGYSPLSCKELQRDLASMHTSFAEWNWSQVASACSDLKQVFSCWLEIEVRLRQWKEWVLATRPVASDMTLAGTALQKWMLTKM